MKKSYGQTAPEYSEAQLWWFGLHEISTVRGRGQRGRSCCPLGWEVASSGQQDGLFAILLPDALLHPTMKQNILSLPLYFFLLVGQNEKNYVFALSNWLRDMINVLIQDVEFRLGWFFQCS